MRNSLKFITWPAIAGLLAALLILDRFILPQGVTAVRSGKESGSYAKAVMVATPSVVNIYTAKLIQPQSNALLEDPLVRRFAQTRARPKVEQSLGSGVIMSDQGYILTNNHVIAGADAIQVLLHDGRSVKAQVIGADAATDLAVIQIELPNLQPIKVGDSNAIQVGDVALAIGNPLGFGHSVTQGIISALGRYGLRQSNYEDYIQTDATIHLGSSGGALIDTRGRLLGINTLIYTAGGQTASSPTGSGISLAIPVNQAEFVMQDLIAFGKVIRGWLGIRLESRRKAPTGDTPPGKILVEVEVDGVFEGGPANKAGLKLGDIITHINEQAVQDARLAIHQIATFRPGERITITVERERQSLQLHALIGSQSQSYSN